VINDLALSLDDDKRSQFGKSQTNVFTESESMDHIDDRCG